MNRELKFRAWDGQKMRYLDQMFIGVGQIGFSDTHWVDLDAHDKEDTVIMQYTGYSDAKGKKIYKGDIVEVAREAYQPEGPLKKYRVVLNHESLLDVLNHAEAVKDGVVIGNIYENPELVK